jgi:hypothetical protein
MSSGNEPDSGQSLAAPASGDLTPASDEDVAGLWRAGILSWKLWQQQLPIYGQIRALPPMVILFVMLLARQFGKSYLAVLLAVEDCLRYQDRAIMIVGPTLEQTHGIVEPRMRLLVRDAPSGLIVPRLSKHKYEIGTCELIIGGFDVNSSSNRGKTLQNVYVEEVVDSHPDTFKESMEGDLGPAMTHSDFGKLVFLSTLPKVPDHPFITETIPKAQLLNAFASRTIDDNIALSPEQKALTIERSGGIGSLTVRRELYNEIIRDPNVLVVPSFNEKEHVGVFAIPMSFFLEVTIDLGGVRDKTCALLHTYDFLSDTVLFLDEAVHDPNTPMSTIVASFRELERRALTIVEDDVPIHNRTADVPGQTQVDLVTDHKYPVQTPIKSDWQSMVNNMAVHFSRAKKVLVHPRCRFLIASLRSGTFNKQKTDFGRTEALGHMDGLAACMYALRAQDRADPYPAGSGISRNVYRRQDRQEQAEVHVAEAVQGKTFATNAAGSYFRAKRFGGFKK